MRRIITVLVLTTALVATFASSALAGTLVPCTFGCFGVDSVTTTDLR